MSYSKRLLAAAISIAVLTAVALILPRLWDSGSGAYGAAGHDGWGATYLGTSERAASTTGVAFATSDISLLHAGLAEAEGDQAHFGDLKVEEGEVIEGDVIIYDGNAQIESGGLVDGDLVVYSGKVEVDAGGGVDGSVSAFAGDVKVAGTIGGDLTVWSGDVDLKSSAVVEGDISVLNGDVMREPGATIGGNVVTGPNLGLPPVPAVPFKFADPLGPAGNRVAGAGPAFLQRLGSFMLRLTGVALLSLLIGLVAWLVAQVRPATIHGPRKTLLGQPALSFVVGILANVVLLVSGAFLAATLCLMPLSLVLFLLFIALNLAGWAIIASVVSQRVSARLGWSVRWDYGVGITAAAMAGALGILWAMGGCFRFFGLAGMLIVSSIGAGAIVLPYIRKNLEGSTPLLPEASSAGGAEDTEPMPHDADNPANGQTETAEPETEQTDEGLTAAGSSSAAKADDFTQIRGLGPVAAGRLFSAGVTAYADLSEMTPEQIGEILRWSPDRVRQSDIVGQAAELAGGGA